MTARFHSCRRTPDDQATDSGSLRGVHPQALNPNRIQIYVPRDKRPWVEEAREALHRDGSSLSDFLIQLLEEWWQIHKPGNPQVSLERYDVKPGPRPSFSDVGIGGKWFSPKVGIWFTKRDPNLPPEGWTWEQLR